MGTVAQPRSLLRSRSGFTLIEALVVIALLTILAAVSVGSLQTFTDRAQVNRAARSIATALADARAQTLSSRADLQYGVHVDANQVVVFEGATYTAGAATNDVRPLSPKVAISSIALSGGVSDVVFTRLWGKASASGSITVSLATNAAIQNVVYVNSAGLIDTL